MDLVVSRFCSTYNLNCSCCFVVLLGRFSSGNELTVSNILKVLVLVMPLENPLLTQHTIFFLFFLGGVRGVGFPIPYSEYWLAVWVEIHSVT